MNRLTTIANTLALALGITAGACAMDGDAISPAEPATTTAPASPGTPAATTPVYDQGSQDDLGALRALAIFEVGHLLVDLPAESTACYSLPCAGWEDAVADEVERQRPRLQALAEIATDAAAAVKSAPPAARPGDAETAAALEALRALAIVEVGTLIQETPVADPSCYNLPCPDEVTRIEAENLARAETLVRLAEDAAGL